MFLAVLRHELKHQLTSLTYYIFLGVILLFYLTQYDAPHSMEELKPVAQTEAGQKGVQPNYGQKKITDPQGEMRRVVMQMKWDERAGTTTRTVLLLNKIVKLDESQLQALRDTAEAIQPGVLSDESGSAVKEPPIAVTYDKYLDLVRELDRKLGGSTIYGDSHRADILYESKTYEEALQDYEDVISKDKITGASGRLFADYMGITAGFFPVFLAAFTLGRDRRTGMAELIYTRRFRAWQYVVPKYAAICVSVMAGYLLLAAHATWEVVRMANEGGMAVRYTAIFQFTLGWIGPTVMATTALGMLIPLAVRFGAAAIPVQFVIWMSSMMPLEGDYPLWKWLIRYNTFGGYGNYAAWKADITANRLAIMLLSAAMVAAAVMLWERKRGRGGASY